MNEKAKQTILGILISNLFGITVIGLTKYLFEPNSNAQGIFIFSEFIVLPMLMGIIAAWFWRGLGFSGWKLFLYNLYNVSLAIALSYLFMGEGVICLVIVSPLLLLFLYIGTLMGRAMFDKDNQTLNVSIITVLLVVFVMDSLATHQYENEVSDTITINAAVNKVWPNVVAFKRIEQKPTFWLFQIGLPSPMETIVDGYYKGAGRKCIFSNGYTFGERISTFEPGHDLVFDITDQPRDPEIMNHLDLIRGEFVLKDNGNGTTTLTGNSWYKLYVFPAWYYDLWTQSIVRNVHVRVMEHIKELSEK